MALDGIILSKINSELQNYLPFKLNKIYDISSNEILLQCRSNRSKLSLIISCHSIYNRINITTNTYPTPLTPSQFVMVLRKYTESGLVVSIEQYDYDRYLKLEIQIRNEIGDKVTRFLYIELMGKYANIILVNEENKIVDALKRIPPFENSSRTILPSAIFKQAKVQEKQNPYENPVIDFEQNLTSQLQGFSPLLTKEFEYRLANGEQYKDIIELMKNSNNLYVHDSLKDDSYHVLPLTHLKSKYKNYPINQALDIIYFSKEEKDRIRQTTGDLFKLVKREIKHLTQKLPKLTESYNQALDCEKWQEYGDYLNAYSYQINKGDTNITFERFDMDGDITIPLDSKLDGKGNAKLCFKKYNKGKKGQIHLLQQIEICKEELEYFNALFMQLEIANFNDAIEIRDDLVKNNYLKAKQTKNKKPKKIVAPNITTLKIDDYEITFGKNNIQNDYITFKYAKKDYTWFHAKDFHGSHLVINSSDLNEKIIRIAANIAAYYSTGKMSSSVPVNYCKVSQLKKIPASKLGLVQLTSYKTIYIDPDKDLIEDLLSEHKITK